MNQDMPILLTCPVCGGKVASDAGACPHCGHPMAKPREPLVSDETIEVAKTYVTESGRKAGRILLAVFKFAIWVFLAGLIGTFASEVCQGTVKNIDGWQKLVILYPLFVTLPCIGLAHVLVSNRFARLLMAICSLVCVPSAATVYEELAVAGMLQANTHGVAIVGAIVAYAWSCFFIIMAKGDPAIVKHARIAVCMFNALMAGLFVAYTFAR